MRTTDLLATRDGHHVNRGNANVSFSDRLCFWYYGDVRPSFLPLSCAHRSPQLRSVSDSLKNSHNGNVSKLQWSPFSRGSGRIEGTVDTSESYGRSRLSRTSQHGTYIISTEGQQSCEKPHGLNFENDSENPAENSVPV